MIAKKHQKSAFNLIHVLTTILLFILMLMVFNAGSLAAAVSDIAEVEEENAFDRGNNQAGNDGIRFSNTKFPGMEGLSREEEILLQTAEEMVAEAQLEKLDRNNYYGNKLSITNTSGVDFPFCEIKLLLFDSSGVAVQSSEISLNDWKNGEAVRENIGFNSSLNSNWANAKIELRFQMADSSSWYRTGLHPLHIARSMTEDGIEENGKIRIYLRDSLPRQYTVYSSRYGNSVYTLSDFKEQPTEYENNYRFGMLMTKLSGPENTREVIYYRLLRNDGVIITSGEADISYLRPGDVFRIDETVYLSRAGDYTLEFIEMPGKYDY